jgi:MFS family permease
MNSTTLIIALPTLMLDLNTTLTGVMWVLISYMPILTILAPASGRLADIYGRKKNSMSSVSSLSPSHPSSAE